MTRRANGEGSVFRLTDGSWRAACPGGKPSFRGATRAEAIRRRESYLRGARKITVLPRQARDSFAAILSRWLDSRREALRSRTIESYHETATRHIIPAIGSVPVGKITAADIAKAMMSASSARTRNYVRTVCHLALEYAVDLDIVPRNVARKVDPVVASHREREMPSLEQWAALLRAIEAESVSTRALLLVLAFCGLRVGEIGGLRWPDYSDGHLRIVRAMGRDGAISPVKTAAGRRVVPVGTMVSAALDRWREEQSSCQVKHSRRWRKAAVPDLIFTTRYGTPVGQRNILRAVHRVSARAGMGKRSAHYLRHMAISHLISDPTVDIKTVQVIAGHSSIRVTLDTYGHLVPGRMQAATDAMNRRSGVPPRHAHDAGKVSDLGDEKPKV